MKILLPIVGAALLLTACPSRCREACENAAKICAEQFAATGKTFDVNTCANECEWNLDGCKNLGDQESCVAEATQCGDLEKCPGCVQ